MLNQTLDNNKRIVKKYIAPIFPDVLYDSGITEYEL